MSRKDRRLPPRIDLSNESKVMAKNSSSPQLLHGVENLVPTSSHLMKKRSEPYRASCRTLVSPHERVEISTRVDPNNNNYQFGQTSSINSLTKLRSFRPQTILIQDEATQSYSLPSLQIKPSVRQTPADGPSGFQKEGFETLLSFYKDSTSKEPSQLNSKGGEQQYEKSRMGTSQSAGNLINANSKSRPYTVIVQQSADENNRVEIVEEDAEIKRFIEGLTGALETGFSANELEKKMAKLVNKRKEDFWREMINRHEPDFVEIYAIDMMKFAEKKRSKIAVINAQEMTKQVDEHMKENNVLENEAVHLMVYFYRENEEDGKKLVLNQYCFYFAKNGHFDQDLKSEKDVIIFYYLLLALYEIRVGQNIDSLKNLKPSLYRERAVNIMKGAEKSSNSILEKIRPKIYNYCIIQKTYFNLNHTGTATSIYILNLLSIVASKYAKLVLAGLKKRSDSEKSLSQVKKFDLKQKARTFFAKNISLGDVNRLDTLESKNSFLIPGQRTPIKSKSGILDLKSPVSIQRYQILNRTRMDTQESINNQTNAISIMDTTKLSRENTPYVRPKYKKLTTPSLEKINQRFVMSPSKITRKVDTQMSTDERSIGKFSIIVPKPKINKLISPKVGLETTLTPWGDPSSYLYDLTPKIINPDPQLRNQIVIEENRESAEGATTLRQYIASKIKKKNILISDIVKGSKNL